MATYIVNRPVKLICVN